jgi:hypothetical protein
MVAMFEARVLFGSPSAPGGVVPHPGRQMVVLPVPVDLKAVANLTVDREPDLVSTNAQELTGDWRAYADRVAVQGTGDAALFLSDPSRIPNPRDFSGPVGTAVEFVALHLSR